MKHLFGIILFTLITFNGSSQNVFPEKYDGCNTDQFGLESDSITIQHDEVEFCLALDKYLGKKIMKKIKGELKLQIIVDLEGNSCLISIENLTNIKSSKLQLKPWVDTNITWNKPDEKTAALVILEFKNGGIRYRRLGNNGNKGWHYLEK